MANSRGFPPDVVIEWMNRAAARRTEMKDSSAVCPSTTGTPAGDMLTGRVGGLFVAVFALIR